jgi:hypothetical protein
VLVGLVPGGLVLVGLVLVGLVLVGLVLVEILFGIKSEKFAVLDSVLF